MSGTTKLDGERWQMSLAEVERRFRSNVSSPGQGRQFYDEAVLLAEYDRRGAEIMTLENNTGYLRDDVLRLQERVDGQAWDELTAERDRLRVQRAAALALAEDLEREAAHLAPPCHARLSSAARIRAALGAGS